MEMAGLHTTNGKNKTSPSGLDLDTSQKKKKKDVETHITRRTSGGRKYMV